MNLEVDESRMGMAPTGIPIRANVNGHWGTFDIVHLKWESLIEWLRSRGEVSDFAVNVVLLLLGHQPL